MYKCNNCGNQSKKEHIKCPQLSCGKVGTYVDIGEVKKNYSIPKVSAKKKLEIENNKGSKSELDKWFEARRGEMKGVCSVCGGRSEKNNDKTFKNSIAHLFPKRKDGFPSVSTNVNNWVELCFYGESHHTNFDTSMFTWDDLLCSNAGVEVSNKALLVYEDMVQSEKNKAIEIINKIKN